MSISADRRRVRNTVKASEDGISFDSKAERSMYLLLKKLRSELPEISIKFHPPSYPLVFPVSLQENRVTAMLPKRKKDSITGKYKDTKDMVVTNSLRSMTYQTDFVVVTKKHIIFIETKGWSTDSFKLRRKLFLSRLSEGYFIPQGYEAVYLEPHTPYQRNQVISLIKHYECYPENAPDGILSETEGPDTG